MTRSRSWFPLLRWPSGGLSGNCRANCRAPGLGLCPVLGYTHAVCTALEAVAARRSRRPRLSFPGPSSRRTVLRGSERTANRRIQRVDTPSECQKRRAKTPPQPHLLPNPRDWRGAGGAPARAAGVPSRFINAVHPTFGRSNVKKEKPSSRRAPSSWRSMAKAPAFSSRCRLPATAASPLRTRTASPTSNSTGPGFRPNASSMLSAAATSSLQAPPAATSGRRCCSWPPTNRRGSRRDRAVSRCARRDLPRCPSRDRQ